MNKERVIRANLQSDLSDCLQERLAFNISGRAADFRDDHVRVGKIGDRHIVALRGILLACFADEMIPQESRPVEFGGTEPSVIDVVGEIVGFLPAIEAAHAPTFPLRCL